MSRVHGIFDGFEETQEGFCLAITYNSRICLAGHSWGGRLTDEIVPALEHGACSTLLSMGYKNCHLIQEPLKGHAIMSGLGDHGRDEEEGSRLFLVYRAGSKKNPSRRDGSSRGLLRP